MTTTAIHKTATAVTKSHNHTVGCDQSHSQPLASDAKTTLKSQRARASRYKMAEVAKWLLSINPTKACALEITTQSLPPLALKAEKLQATSTPQQRSLYTLHLQHGSPKAGAKTPHKRQGLQQPDFLEPPLSLGLIETECRILMFSGFLWPLKKTCQRYLPQADALPIGTSMACDGPWHF